MRKLNDDDLASRQNQIVQAATSVFLRYGYVKTTMADLAAAAKVSRPTLYEIFPGKEDLFTAVVRRLNQETINKYRQQLARLTTLESRLHKCCGDWALHGLRLAQQHPDAKDLFSFEFAVVREMYDQFVDFLLEVVSSDAQAPKAALRPILRNLVFSLRGLKEAAENVEQMQELVTLQIDVFLPIILAEL